MKGLEAKELHNFPRFIFREETVMLLENGSCLYVSLIEKGACKKGVIFTNCVFFYGRGQLHEFFLEC